LEKSTFSSRSAAAAFAGAACAALFAAFFAAMTGLDPHAQVVIIFLPSVVSELLAEDKADVKVLKSLDKWYGVTYKEDKPVVVNAICKLKAEGKYPEKLWEE